MARRFRSTLVALAVIGAGLGAVPGGAAADPSLTVLEARVPSSTRPARSFVPREVLVRFAPSAARAARRDALARVGGTIARSMPAIGFHLVRTAVATPVAVRLLAASAAVAVAEPNLTGTLALSANDPCLNGCGNGRQWNAGAVNAPAGWAAYPGRFYTAAAKKAETPIKVAVLDTKVFTGHGDWINASPLPVNHPQSSANGGQLDLANARDFLPESAHAGSADYHGTFVAGILGAAANNGAGIAGLGYRAEIVPVTVVDGGGVVSAADLASGILYARSVGARVINLSLGLHQTSTAVQDAVDLATASGSLVVAAAGNNADAEPFYPAWHRHVMSVSGVDEADRRAPCSNFNGHISVAAPGMNILSMDPRTPSGYSIAGCGTSTAAPHVSALAALLFAQDPARTPAQVRSIIERTADDDRFHPGRDDFYGRGRINFERALREGEGPVVDRVIASVPRALGGTSTYRATATAAGARPILEAEWFVDRLGAPGTGGAVFAADGAFGGTSEGLTVDVGVPLGFPSGIHRLFIRARDTGGWGAASVGVLIVDRNPPRIGSFEASPLALGTAGQPVELVFEAADDHARTLTYSYEVIDRVTDEVVFVSPEFAMSEREVTEWLPGTGVRGAFTITLTVRDDAGNPARAKAQTIVL